MRNVEIKPKTLQIKIFLWKARSVFSPMGHYERDQTGKVAHIKEQYAK